MDGDLETKSRETTKDARVTAPTSSFSLTHWRNIYLIFSVLLRYLLALQTSYIHPDEFFQSFQYLYGDNVPWEFRDGSCSRSYAPLLVFYVPIQKFGEWNNFEPILVYYIARMSFSYISAFIMNWYIYELLPIKQERMKALFFISTSYVTLCYQSHTFSNSIETILLIVVLTIINDMRLSLEDSETVPVSKKKLVSLGMLLSFGLFNRVTFIAWLVVPSYFVLKYFIRHPVKTIMAVGFGFVTVTSACILLDTYHFTGKYPVLSDPSSWLITPLNNLLYNSNIENLSNHGLHPYYQHILINYPTMFGPLILLVFPFNTTYISTTPFLSLISGITILSFIPHQELRFLQPMVPLVASCVSLNFTSSSYKKTLGRIIITAWIFFNLAFCLIMGVLHQGGIVYSLEFLQNTIQNSRIDQDFVFIFWRTYKPPTFLLGDSHVLSKNVFYNRDETDLLKFDYSTLNRTKEKNFIFDLMGTPLPDVNEILNEIKGNSTDNQKVYFVAPLSSTLDEILDRWDQKLSLSWYTYYHYDLDHFEFDKYGLSTFKPGIGVYELI